jgi:hypothetical protein
VSGGDNPEFKKEKPGQQLGFSSVGMPERYNTVALTGQSPFESQKKILFVLAKNPGNPIKKEKIQSAEDSEKENNK